MYLPFMGSKGKPVMGLQSLDLQDWIEIGPSFVDQCEYKAWLLAHRHKSVFSAIAGTQSAQQEVLDLLLAHLVQRFSKIYRVVGEGKDCCIHNVKSQQVWRIAEFAQSPLDLAARLVQEDLCLMMPSDDTGHYRLVAASVCFPLRLKLVDKMAQSIGRIHGDVPGYAKRLESPVDKVFSKLRVDYPGQRFNWSVVNSSELHLAEEKYATANEPDITKHYGEERL